MMPATLHRTAFLKMNYDELMDSSINFATKCSITGFNYGQKEESSLEELCYYDKDIADSQTEGET
eukprot:snap_masked-scaffold_2-processed-gene-12.34-mRNA-1 protein AED:1.00 eAED:1.00 QI:0/-1/0/0/-1/1/1/0/64